MAVCGAPLARVDHVEVMCRFALRMIDALEKFNSSQKANHGHEFGLRIGINCGHIVAGVVGTTKYLYDVWYVAVVDCSSYFFSRIQGDLLAIWQVEWRAQEWIVGFKLAILCTRKQDIILNFVLSKEGMCFVKESEMCEHIFW